MDARTLARWRGLKTLIVDATVHGSRAIEKVQRETAGRTFAILEAVPIVAGPAKAVHLVHDLSLGVTHQTIRAVAGAVSVVADHALDQLAPPEEGGPAGPAA